MLKTATILYLIGLMATQLNAAELDYQPAPTNQEPVQYTMPSEEEPHEGTWIAWPHNYDWDSKHVERYEPIWIAMTKALHTGETVHIIAWNEKEKTNIKNKLNAAGINLNNIDFLIAKTNDVWMRDNGPVFVHDQNKNLVITNWEFNGWGEDADYHHDRKVPESISAALDLPILHLDLVNEGGSIELDGHGTLLAKRSSIFNNNRNPGITQQQAENYFRKYLGATHFIWLDGIPGEDITDDHIDGTARFAANNTLLINRQDYLAEGEYEILTTATNAQGKPYQIIELPIAENLWGSDLYGVYVNYYIGNQVVIVPNFNRENIDQQANTIIQDLYPDRKVIGIDITELYKDGGALHCVTQQQPL